MAIKINVPSRVFVGEGVFVDIQAPPGDPLRTLIVEYYSPRGMRDIRRLISIDASGRPYKQERFVPTLPGVWKIRASIDGEVAEATCEAAIPKSPSSITLLVSPPRIAFGDEVILSGSVHPIRGGLDVTLYVSRDFSSWKELIRLKTNPMGRFSYRFRPQEWGNYYFKASWEGDQYYFGSESHPVGLVVEAFGNLSGRVVDSDLAKMGHPRPFIPGAEVLIAGRSQITHGDGTFFIPNLPLKRHKLIIRHPYYKEYEEEVELTSPGVKDLGYVFLERTQAALIGR